MDRNQERRGLSRRGLMTAGAATALAALGTRATATAIAATPPTVPHPATPQYVLQVAATTLDPDGKAAVPGITVNGTYPGPLIRAREGDVLRLQVENRLATSPTSIHWHGLLVPAGMDGVPVVSNAPIAAERVAIFEFPLRQSGTYWYHSHFGFQEQIGLAGPLVIEPRDESLHADHDAVVMLSDWTHQSPEALFAKLRGDTKPAAGTAGMAKPGDMAKPDAAAKPAGGAMQMDGGGKPDLSDVRYDAFLLNGRAADDPWTLAARPGETIRLRLINAGTSTYFRVRLDGHPLRITHADGLPVEPVTVDHVSMGMAECYDAVVTLAGSGSFTLHAVAQDGSGQAIGVLHTPDARPTPNAALPAFDGRALAYADLHSPIPTTLPPGDAHPIALPLGGDMQRYVWTLGGQAWPEADPLVVRQGERVQLTLENRTMMWHPMHLHGHFFRVLQGAGEYAPLKHTANVAPGETLRVEFTADNPGRWFFHCHNLYHLEGGMARMFEYAV
ncbi:MAG: multicopper oxidase domain-containing protein [bacterium]|nr:multicopper oxidase domain-containing protein [bacterium]